MKVNYIKAFKDNYIWVIEEEKDVILVDPGQAQPVIDYLSVNKKKISAILLTHEHEDHVGGLTQLQEVFGPFQVFGPKEVAHLVTRVVSHGDHFKIKNLTFQVLKTAGHTKEHISFYAPGFLFCGDALFMAGCGRVFTKDYQAQYNSLLIFRDLPDNTLVYAGHEYSLTNINFALSLQPNNQELLKSKNGVEEKLEQGKPSLPSTIKQEKQINCLMMAPNLEKFIELITLRDNF